MGLLVKTLLGIFFLLFFWSLCSGLRELWIGLGTLGWKKVPATVQKFEIVPKTSSARPAYGVELEYRYLFKGERFTGHSFSFNARRGYHEKSLRKIFGDLAPSTCEVLVNPEDPRESVAYNGLDLKLFLLIVFSLLFELVIGFFLVGSLRS